VRVVTFDTIPLSHYLMGTACLFGYDIGVASEADLIGIRCQEFTMGGCMGVMTAHAFSRFYRGMDRRQLELVLKRHMAGQAILSLRSRFQPELIFLCAGGRNDPENTNHNKHQEHLVPYIHAFIFHRFSPTI
jgi:hypothetical protein